MATLDDSLRRTTADIRPFVTADTAALVALWNACELTRPWNDPVKDILRKQQVQPEGFLVAVQGADLVGSVMAGYDGHRGWINYLAVHPDHRLGGLGRRLMAEAEQRLAALGCPKINLQIRRTNTAALGFYAAIGFVQDDVISVGKRLVED
jgi:ribosomal protein S18 acetylase RimI-like enzyme